MDSRMGLATTGAALLFLLACLPAEQPDPDGLQTGSLDEVGVRDRDSERTERGERCDDSDPLRQAYFGDLHIHTAVSMDAYMFDTRTQPDDAYRFARGEPVLLPPLDEEGRGTREIQIERPLDFAAVTDHAENFGGVRLCSSPGSPVYDSESCTAYRTKFKAGTIAQDALEIVRRINLLSVKEICGPNGARCREAATQVWRETQEAAEGWYDRCAFTTFIGYEYTATPDFTSVHRNVIFRNEVVPPLPISYLEEPTAEGLWRRLRSGCNDSATGCDALAIPHNSNSSNGQMFVREYGSAVTRDEQAAIAGLRAEMEPLVEIMQIKGDSECRNGMWDVLGGVDELCGFEKIRTSPVPLPDCRDGKAWGALAGKGCVSRLDFVRYALIEGLREADRIGVNPYKFGVIASTDTHDGTPGPVEEFRLDGFASRRLPSAGMNPGGLVAIWAEENSREALFEGMRRREVYGTSGPRISARFFGGWEYPEALCADPGLLSEAYAGGVPMGGDLAPAPSESARPTFVVSALRDPGTPKHPGGHLQRIQIIKGWVGDDGKFHQAVHDVAGSATNDASVDAATCEPRGPGADSLCAVWSDPEFDPRRRAVYYARVVENPSCRNSTWVCLSLPSDERPDACASPLVPKTIQERAWTSPIWYEPATAATEGRVEIDIAIGLE